MQTDLGSHSAYQNHMEYFFYDLPIGLCFLFFLIFFLLALNFLRTNHEKILQVKYFVKLLLS